MSTANGGASASNASVNTTPRPGYAQDYLDTYADECDLAVQVIEEKLAGIKESLAAAKAEAKRARAEARKGDE